MGRPTVRSLRFKVPALIASVVAASLAVFGWTAYRAVRDSAEAGAHARVRQVARDLASLFAASFANETESALEVAADPVLAAALRDPVRMDSAAVRAALERVGTLSDAVADVELRDAAGRRVLGLAPEETRAPFSAPPEDESVTALTLVGDTAEHRQSTPVTDGGGRILGWVSEVRRMHATP